MSFTAAHAALADMQARMKMGRRRDFPTETDCQTIERLLKQKHGLASIAAHLGVSNWEEVRDVAAEMGLLMKTADGNWCAPRSPAAIAKPRHKAQRRKCMRCGREFLSDGPHHRMCSDCRRSAHSISPMAL